MPQDIRYVYELFRRKGLSHELSLAIALHCCNPDQPAPGWTHEEQK